MRFRLLEAPVSQSDTAKLFQDVKDDNKRDDAILTYVQNRGNTDLYNILSKNDTSGQLLMDIIADAIKSGNEVAEQFDFVISNIDIKSVSPNNYRNFNILLQNIKSNTIKITNSSKYMLDASLYDRDSRDFEFAAKVLDIVHDPAKLRKSYGQNAEKLSPKTLYDGDKLKPSGFVSKDVTNETIYRIVRDWNTLYASGSGNSSANDNASDNTSRSKYTTYKSTSAANKDGQNKKGKIVHIDGDFQFNGKEWVPYEQ